MWLFLSNSDDYLKLNDSIQMINLTFTDLDDAGIFDHLKYRHSLQFPTQFHYELATRIMLHVYVSAVLIFYFYCIEA